MQVSVRVARVATLTATVRTGVPARRGAPVRHRVDHRIGVPDQRTVLRVNRERVDFHSGLLHTVVRQPA
jgi:hypothetical protein